MLNSQIIPLLPGSIEQESVLCLAGKLFHKLWSGRNNKSSRRCANADVPCSAKWEHLPPLLPQIPSGATSPLLSLLQSWKYLCVSSPGRAGAPGNQNPAAEGAAKPGAPHARCGFGAPAPETPALCNTLCKPGSTGHSTSLVRPHRAGLGVQERFPSNPSALSNVPGRPDLHSRQDAIPGSPGGFVNLTTPGLF